MGGFISYFRKEPEPDDERNLRKYNENMESDSTASDTDELIKRRITWWEKIFCDKRVRISYVLILALVLGIVIPMILFITHINKEKTGMVYGSCMIKNNARFECLINSAKIVDENECMEAMCCWENAENNLPFKCYHSLPSAYHYRSAGVQNDDGRTILQLTPPNTGGENLTNLQTSIHWATDSHLVVEMFNPEAFPERGPGSFSSTEKSGEIRQDENGDDLPLHTSWGEENGFFHLKIVRNGTNETIFDTRLGPIIATEKYMSISTLLPTQYFYGLKGGQGSISTQTFVAVNGFENMELPFYMSYERSGMWHGMLIDTDLPFIFQVVQAPAIMFHVETELPEVNLNFFVGPTQKDIITQMHTHIKEKHSITHEPLIPPYWSLGLHLCRKVDNSSVVKEDIETLIRFPYDSDCIDEDLRQPISVDEDRFPDTPEIIRSLTENNKKIILSQKITAPVNETEDTLPDGIWLLHINSTMFSKQIQFNGKVDNVSMKYIDFLNPAFEEFPLPQIKYDGIMLNDNFPKLYNASIDCVPPKTRIEAAFINVTSTSNGTNFNVSLAWGAVCPETLHVLEVNGGGGVTENINDFDGTEGLVTERHGTVHNQYGHIALKRIYDSLSLVDDDVEQLVSSSSISVASSYYGGFSGLQVPFTWQGLRESLAHTIRNFAVTLGGTQICGSNIWNVSLKANDDLCLRWFQFGLMLPLVQNSYDGNSSYGPIHLTDQYKGYLAEAIRNRYAFSPYFYTTLHEQLIPFIRPMSYDFRESEFANSSQVIKLVDQFMVGESILVAPIVDVDLHRDAYFPSGIWYTKEGLEVYHNQDRGDFRRIAGYMTEAPMFIRGGSIIPTLHSADALTISETLYNDYTLIIALSTTNADNERISYGKLTVKDIDDYHLIEFNATFTMPNGPMTVEITSVCASGPFPSPPTSQTTESDSPTTTPESIQDLEQETISTTETDPTSTTPEPEPTIPISTLITQVRMLAFPLEGALTATVTSGNPDEKVQSVECKPYGDHKSVRCKELSMNWCASASYKLVVEKAEESD